MLKKISYSICFLAISCFLACGYSLKAEEQDTLTPRYPIPQLGLSGEAPEEKSLFSRSNVKEVVKYNPEKNEYDIVTMLGDLELGRRTLTAEEYLDYELEKSKQAYWKTKLAYTPTSSSGLSSLLPGLNIKTDFLDNLFGKDFIKFDLNGSIELTFGLKGTRRDDPALDVDRRKTFNFDFDSKIDINLNAKIGDMISFDINHNTEALFDFDNKLKLKYDGKEDDIIKYIEAGNVSFPLNTSLIRGVQDLFGVSAKFQFGNTYITGVFSEQKSESRNIKVEGGAQSTEFEIRADDYEANQHYFLSQYFRDNYHEALKDLPIVNSAIQITKIEVWVTNVGAPVEDNRNVVALTDLGEKKPWASNITGYPETRYPSNQSNNIFGVINRDNLRNINTVSSYLTSTFGYTGGQEFEKVESARRLKESEYTFNPKLGFISLNQPLNSDQVLSVAYQYQIIGDSTVYQVGELSDQGINDPQVLITKLLKSTILNTQSPLWKLMMKNVYSLHSYQISSEDFRLDLFYAGDDNGVPTGYFKNGPKSGIPLIRVFGMDNLDFQQNQVSDGVFDFVDNAATGAGLIQTNKGLIFIPYVEPFGSDLIKIFGDSVAAMEYAFPELYTKTKTEAQQFPDKNKYHLAGRYKSAYGSEISLGVYNLPPGSVKVMAGNNVLVEGTDYTVNYAAGMVQIINQGVLNSGVPINISTESSSNSFLTKRMMGLRVEHFFQPDFYVGATLMNLHQAPLTNKVNFGEEPISNTIYGFDAAYDRESRWLTKAVDAILPFQSSSSPSRISLSGEFAQFLPGHAKAIGKEGVTYIDDFEGAKSTINLKETHSWYLASTPQNQLDLFPESADIFASSTATGFNRAKLAWYTIDPIFYESRTRPKNITTEDLSNPYSRRVRVNEVFPNRELANDQPSYLTVLNLAFYPREKGPYNFDVQPQGAISAGIDAEGNLLRPETRWGGIMRKITNTDFEANNVEYIEFWVMDPFIGAKGENGGFKHDGGVLYFNLGDVSEDVLRDGRKSFENGIPIDGSSTGLDITQWGRVPVNQAIVTTFDNDPATRIYQDIGLDGLNDEDEREFFRTSYLEQIADFVGETSTAYRAAYDDPSSDNFFYFRRGFWDTVESANGEKILNRYKHYNNPEGNSPSSANNPESYPTQQTNYPNTEDISGDNTMSEFENYFQYEVYLHPDNMKVGENYITDYVDAHVTLPNEEETVTRWYQFKIPIKNPDKVVGQIQNFQSIRFMRMFMKGFRQDIVLRFASLDLVKADWRKYDQSLLEDNVHISSGNVETQCDVGVVNIEENGYRAPINYVLPPGLERSIDPSVQNNRQLNEQSVSLKISNLADGDARGIYKTTNYDFRQFKRLEMFVHLEKVHENDLATNGDVTMFLRFGSDFQENYYEYEIPLSYTQWGQSARDLVWPEENKVVIDLETLVQVKEHRNELVRNQDPYVTNSVPYSERIGNAVYTIKGTPNISAVKMILIGVRNPQKIRVNDGDDGRSKSVEVWVNELSLNEFSKKSGFAVTGRMYATLGDLGNISVAGAYTSANFGGLEEKITELSQDNVGSYDVAVNLELGKFLPEKAGVRLPLHYDVSSVISNPEYNPLDPDVKTSHDLKSYSPEERKEKKRQIQDRTFRQNVNFVNVGKDRTNTSRKPMFWDVENLNLSYMYSQVNHSNADIEYDNKVSHRGGLGYDFSTSPKFYEPLRKTKLAESKYATFLTDFNINPIPNQFTFNMEIQRDFNEQKLRNKNDFGEVLIEPTYFKRFDWSRRYVFNWDITKSININYSANANSFLNEPFGKLNTVQKKDSVWKSFFDGGQMRNFDQNLGISYTIPINKLPFLDWVTASVRYATIYTWESGPLATQDRLGNVISNSMNLSATGSLNFVTLYNYVPFLKKINSPPRIRRTGRKSNTVMAQNNERESGDKAKKAWETTYKGFIRFLMLIRDANISWNRNTGTTLPGFMLQPDLFGVNFNANAPGLGFSLFGSQRDIREKAGLNGWLSTDTLMTQSYHNNFTENITAQMTVEPFKDFRIMVNLAYSKTENHTSYYRFDNAQGKFGIFNPLTQGSYNVTNIMLLTAFQKSGDDFSTEAFQNFLEYRKLIARRLSAANPNSSRKPEVYDTLTGQFFPYGYGPTSPEVMLPALLAAYNGIDPNKVALNGISKFPLPNWSLTYNGLTKIKGMKKVFKNFSISHAYSSSYSIGGYKTNELYDRTNEYAWVMDINNNFVSPLEYQGIELSEQFSPLIKINATFINDFSLNFEYRDSRKIVLSFVNNQITEMTSKEWVAGAGYRIKNVGFKVKTANSAKKNISSDIVLKADFSIRNNRTLIRKLNSSENMPSAGAIITSLNVYAEYEFTKQLSARVFFDMILNKPHIANLFYNSTTKGGVSVIYRFVE